MSERNRSASWGQVALLAGLLAAFVYTGHNALIGAHGLLALVDNSQEIAALEIERDRLGAEHARMARDVQLLSPPMVDRDLLDERARTELGFVRDNEQVIFRGRE